MSVNIKLLFRIKACPLFPSTLLRGEPANKSKLLLFGHSLSSHFNVSTALNSFSIHTPSFTFILRTLFQPLYFLKKIYASSSIFHQTYVVLLQPL